MSSLNEEVSPILLWAWLEASQLGMISVALCWVPKVPKNVILERSMYVVCKLPWTPCPEGWGDRAFPYGF